MNTIKKSYLFKIFTLFLLLLLVLVACGTEDPTPTPVPAEPVEEAVVEEEKKEEAEDVDMGGLFGDDDRRCFAQVWGKIQIRNKLIHDQLLA